MYKLDISFWYWIFGINKKLKCLFLGRDSHMRIKTYLKPMKWEELHVLRFHCNFGLQRKYLSSNICLIFYLHIFTLSKILYRDFYREHYEHSFHKNVSFICDAALSHVEGWLSYGLLVRHYRSHTWNGWKVSMQSLFSRDEKSHGSWKNLKKWFK